MSNTLQWFYIHSKRNPGLAMPRGEMIVDMQVAAKHEGVSDEAFLFAYLATNQINTIIAYQGYGAACEDHALAFIEDQPTLIQLSVLRALFCCNRIEAMYVCGSKVELHLIRVTDPDKLVQRTVKFMSKDIDDILYRRG